MKSRKKNPPKKIAPITSTCAIIPIDGTKVRIKAKKAYEKIRKDLDKARLELDRFQSKDQPDYQKWLNRTFGRLLTEIRESGQILEAKRQLMFEVENEVYFSGLSYKQAYRRVMARKENPPPPEPEPNREFGGSSPSEEPSEQEFDPDSGGAYGSDWDEVDDEFARFFEELFGIPGGSGRHRPSPEPPPPSKQGTGRVKMLYRAVVRRLHPDVQSKMSSQKLEWWHQAQTAYEQDDAEQLEMILTLCEIEDSGSTSHASVSLLTRITSQFRSTLRSIRREISKFKRDPAWNFSLKPNIESLRNKVENDLKWELREIQDMLAMVEAQIAEWARVPLPRKSRSNRRPIVRDQPEFPF